MDIITVSMDLPFAQKRWCGAFGVDKVKMLSDHKDGSFGSHYGTLIKELRIESRAIFVIDPENKIRHAEYVKEVADHPELRSRAFGRPERRRRQRRRTASPEAATELLRNHLRRPAASASSPARWKTRWCAAV